MKASTNQWEDEACHLAEERARACRLESHSEFRRLSERNEHSLPPSISDITACSPAKPSRVPICSRSIPLTSLPALPSSSAHASTASTACPSAWPIDKMPPSSSSWEGFMGHSKRRSVLIWHVDRLRGSTSCSTDSQVKPKSCSESSVSEQCSLKRAEHNRRLARPRVAASSEPVR